MANCSFGAKFTCFAVGLAAGAAVALLLAPKTGEQTRKLIARKAGEGKDYITAKGRAFKDRAEELVEKGKELVTRQSDLLAGVFETGKDAARKFSIM